MRDLTLTEGFALISLNTQDSVHRTVAKTAALRCIAAAQVLDLYFQGQYALDALPNALLEASKIPHSKRKELEANICETLLSEQLIDEVPALLGCDYYYYSATVTMREYRTPKNVFVTLTEQIKAEILEDALPSDETICYLWLLRESYCMHDIFSLSEQESIQKKLSELVGKNSLAKTLLPVVIHKPTESLADYYLRFKSKVFRDPAFQSLNQVFPFLERRQAVFIDTEAYCSNPSERLTDVLTRLEKMGHENTIISIEGDPIVKVDHTYYQLIPHQIGVGMYPVHGVRLVPYIPV